MVYADDCAQESSDHASGDNDTAFRPNTLVEANDNSSTDGATYAAANQGIGSHRVLQPNLTNISPVEQGIVPFYRSRKRKTRAARKSSA